MEICLCAFQTKKKSVVIVVTRKEGKPMSAQRIVFAKKNMNKYFTTFFVCLFVSGNTKHFEKKKENSF